VCVCLHVGGSRFFKCPSINQRIADKTRWVHSLEMQIRLPNSNRNRNPNPNPSPSPISTPTITLNRKSIGLDNSVEDYLSSFKSFRSGFSFSLAEIHTHRHTHTHTHRRIATKWSQYPRRRTTSSVRVIIIQTWNRAKEVFKKIKIYSLSDPQNCQNISPKTDRNLCPNMLNKWGCSKVSDS